MTTFRISRLTVDQVRAEVREVLARELDVDRMADFLASVDWGGTPGSAEVRELLGALELATTEFGEGDRTRDEYIELLRVIDAQGRVPR